MLISGIVISITNLWFLTQSVKRQPRRPKRLPFPLKRILHDLCPRPEIRGLPQPEYQQHMTAPSKIRVVCIKKISYTEIKRGKQGITLWEKYSM